jgi:hypothetical protein
MRRGGCVTNRNQKNPQRRRRKAAPLLGENNQFRAPRLLDSFPKSICEWVGKDGRVGVIPAQAGIQEPSEFGM